MKLSDWCASTASSLIVVGVVELCIAAGWLPTADIGPRGKLCIIVGVLLVVLGAWRNNVEARLP
jgi:hypothetical protein